LQPKNAFRAILAASVGCSIAYGAVSLFAERHLPTELRDFLEQKYAAEMTTSEVAGVTLGIIYIIAALVNLVFLFRFRAAARPWALFFTLAALPFYILFGPWVETGIGLYLLELAAVLWGAALALMYCVPVSNLFDSEIGHGMPLKAGTTTAVLDEQ